MGIVSVSCEDMHMVGSLRFTCNVPGGYRSLFFSLPYGLSWCIVFVSREVMHMDRSGG